MHEVPLWQRYEDKQQLVNIYILKCPVVSEPFTDHGLLVNTRRTEQLFWFVRYNPWSWSHSVFLLALCITVAFFDLSTKSWYMHSFVLKIVNLMENEVWVIPNALGISEKGQIV